MMHTASYFPCVNCYKFKHCTTCGTRKAKDKMTNKKQTNFFKRSDIGLKQTKIIILTRNNQDRCELNPLIYWVSPSKRGGMDQIFRELEGLVRGIFEGRSMREIPRSSTASPRKTLSIPTFLLGFTFFFK